MRQVSDRLKREQAYVGLELKLRALTWDVSLITAQESMPGRGHPFQFSASTRLGVHDDF